MTDLHRLGRPFHWLDDGRCDLHYAGRTLGRAPGFTFVAVLTLALGIGSVTLIYSVLYNVLLNPLPYRDSARLVNVQIRDTQTGRTRNVFPRERSCPARDSSRFHDAEIVVEDLGEIAAIGHPVPR